VRLAGMSRSALIIFLLGSGVAVVGCNAIGAIVGPPKIVSVTVSAPAGLLVGDSAQATSNALGDDGKTHNGRPVTWRSSDPAALAIDGQGRMVALIGGRTVIITAEVERKTGSATVAVGSDDSRFGYALADQPKAVGPYVPDTAFRYNAG